MSISFKPAHLSRYKDIAWLFYKYGHSELVDAAGLENAENHNGHAVPKLPPRSRTYAVNTARSAAVRHVNADRIHCNLTVLSPGFPVPLGDVFGPAIPLLSGPL